jgi:hypothetical protein
VPWWWCCGVSAGDHCALAPRWGCAGILVGLEGDVWTGEVKEGSCLSRPSSSEPEPPAADMARSAGRLYGRRAERTPENRRGGLLGRPGQKFGRKMGNLGEKVRIGTDLFQICRNLFGRDTKIQFFFQPSGYRRPKKTCAGPNSFGLRPTWVSTGSKFVRMPTDLEQTPGQICSDGPTYLPTYFRGSWAEGKGGIDHMTHVSIFLFHQENHEKNPINPKLRYPGHTLQAIASATSHASPLPSASPAIAQVSPRIVPQPPRASVGCPPSRPPTSPSPDHSPRSPSPASETR